MGEVESVVSIEQADNVERKMAENFLKIRFRNSWKIHWHIVFTVTVAIYTLCLLLLYSCTVHAIIGKHIPI